MFVLPFVPVFAALLAAAASSTTSSEAPASRSCSELARSREDAEAGAARLAAWMEAHCPGTLEETEPFCRLQSSLLLERLDALGQLKAALAAKRCEAASSSKVGAQERASQAIASFDDGWPWPRGRPFQAGLAATAGFKIRRCQADPECEW
jgi:hypothetical protein